MFISTYVFVLLQLLPLALAGPKFHAEKRATDTHCTRSTKKTFKLVDKHQGTNFFDGWDFFSDADPTHGSVNYLSESAAKSAGLAYVQGDGTTIMAVDSKTKLKVGQNRNSVRVTSSKSYNNGLFIADIWSMPHGCSVWPAFWLVGPDWPNGGEIDIIENVGNANNNQMTLHTSEGCTLNPNPSNKTSTITGAIEAFTSTVLGETCASSGSSNLGCSFSSPDTSSYGHNFNTMGGGVYATLWDSTGIYIWFFHRNTIPSDINSGQPNPASWGSPTAFWSSSTCNSNQFFSDMSMVFDITLCGDWAGATYSSSGCPGSCATAVADPTNFSVTKWQINYVAVYQ